MDQINPAAGKHLPGFITGPGQTDVLFVITTLLLIGAVLGVGVLYLHLHALPERIAHRTRKVQLEIVAVLALLALFTHNHLFWVAGLILAFIELPDFGTPMNSMARSLSRLAGREEGTAIPAVAQEPIPAGPADPDTDPPAPETRRQEQRPPRRGEP